MTEGVLTSDSAMIAIALSPKYIRDFCNFCVKKVPTTSMKRCSTCQFVYYCGVECQMRDWSPHHKLECVHLKGKSDRWRSIGNSDVATEAHLYLRLLVAYEKLDEYKATFSSKTFATVVSHRTEAQLRPGNDGLFRSSKKLVDYLMGENVPIDRFTEVYTKTKVNSIDINVWDADLRESLAGMPTPVGIAFQLDIASFDHSCRPNVQTFFDGRKFYVVPLVNSPATIDTENTRMSYTMLTAPRRVRRQNLLSCWYFHCECDRCMDEEDERLLTGIKCSACDYVIRLSDEQLSAPFDVEAQPEKTVFHRLPDQVREHVLRILHQMRSQLLQGVRNRAEHEGMACPKCQTKQSTDRLAYACALMKFVAILFNFSDLLTLYLETDGVNGVLSLQERSLLCEFLEGELRAYLPESNVFFARLQLAMAFDLFGNNPSRKAECLLRWYAVAIRCYPSGHCALFRYQIPLCHALLGCGRFDEANAVLDELENAAKVYFQCGGTIGEMSERCPFASQLRMFRRRIANHYLNEVSSKSE